MTLGISGVALTQRLRKHLPRAAALAIAARNRSTTRGKASITEVLDGLDITELRELATVLALFTDVTGLVTESLEDPMEPIELAIRACARRFGITEDAMLGTSRDPLIVDARQVAAYIAHKLFGISSVQVGRRLKRDHSTVLYGCKVVAADTRLRRVAFDVAYRVGWQQPDTPVGTQVVVA